MLMTVGRVTLVAFTVAASMACTEAADTSAQTVDTRAQDMAAIERLRQQDIAATLAGDVEAIGDTGKVYVIDIEPEALKYVEESLVHMHRSFDAEFILARPDNPKIPFESVDLIFVCNTYHHLTDRTDYFRNVKSSLKPSGRIAIIDFYHDERSGELGFPKRHLVPREKVIEEMTEAGYRLAKEHTFLQKQYFLEFE